MKKGLMLVAALAMAGCGGAGATVEGCNAGWSNYCNKLFTCTESATAAQQAFGTEAQCKTLMTGACAAVQFYGGVCATKYNACISSLQNLTCTSFSSGSTDQPSACDNIDC